jgi:hypothetical protein
MAASRPAPAPAAINAMQQQVAPEWHAWAAENLALGAPRADVTAELVGEGLTAEQAASLVGALYTNPLFAGFVAERRKRARREQVLALSTALRRTATIERRTAPSADEFYQRYYAANTACVFTDFTAGWPARNWSPQWLADTFGDVEMEIASNRTVDPLADRKLDDHREKTTMREYVARVLAAGTSNDIYTVANNKNMDRPEFQRLLDDVVFRADYFNPKHLLGGTSFWFGPGGTTTPLHHDNTNILFHQLYGEKRFVLAPPWELALLDCAEGYYSACDPDAVPASEHNVHYTEITLRPGDTLFLPVGYWHKVTALSVSISFSQLNLNKPNAFRDYAPGANVLL